MVRIIHLSDLHIHKSSSRPDNRNAGALTKYLLDKFKGAPKSKTYVVMTGDLVDDSTTDQYKHLRDDVLAPLTERFTILAAPGNHDYAYGGNLYSSDGPRRFRTYVGPYVKGASYPCVTVNNREGIVFIGLDSADTHDEKWFAEGVVGGEQRAALDACLDNPAHAGYLKIVYLHHHPFLRRLFVALREAEQLLRVLSKTPNRVNLLLFGHKHESEVFFERYRIPLMLASGKVVEPTGDALAFRVVEIDGGKIINIRTEEIRGI
jgi:3',5'-cyclic AMP phosphodiesterase CpdA